MIAPKSYWSYSAAAWRPRETEWREGDGWRRLPSSRCISTTLYSGSGWGESAPVAVGVHFSQDENAAKLVFDLSRAVEAKTAALASPDRIVIDMPEVNFSSIPRLDAQARRQGARL